MSRIRPYPLKPRARQLISYSTETFTSTFSPRRRSNSCTSSIVLHKPDFELFKNFADHILTPWSRIYRCSLLGKKILFGEKNKVRFVAHILSSALSLGHEFARRARRRRRSARHAPESFSRHDLCLPRKGERGGGENDVYFVPKYEGAARARHSLWRNLFAAACAQKGARRARQTCSSPQNKTLP